MPTSVLLAVLAGAGLLALAPALVRRYDADERIAAEREESEARVLERKPRSRTGPGSAPINPPREADDHEAGPDDGTDPPDEESLLASQTPELELPATPASAEPAPAGRRRGWERSGARRAGSVRLSTSSTESMGRNEEVPVASHPDGRGTGRDPALGRADSSRMQDWWRKRHRRVLYVLLVLNFAELLGVIFIGPGFWLGVVVSLALLLGFLRFLRMRVLRGAAQQLRRRRPAVTTRRQVYVPAQSEGDADVPAIEAERQEREDAGFVPGFDGEQDDELDPADEPVSGPSGPAPSRRRTGGIRGRSYESPANL